MIRHLLNTPCTITRRVSGGQDGYYGDEQDEPVTVETECELQQRDRREPDTQGETSDTKWLLVLPAGTEISTGDTVTVDGLEYEMTGDPWPARNPRTQAVSHIEATVRRTS